MAPSFNNELIGTIPHLRAFARSLTGDSDTADDLVQDAIVRALAARQQYTPGTNFKAWIFTILRKFRAEPIDEISPEVWSVLPRQDAKLEIDDFQRALAKLSPEQREVLILVGASGFSYEDAAEICECAVGTIKSRLSRARRDLFKLLTGDALARRATKPSREPVDRLTAVAGVPVRKRADQASTSARVVKLATG
jgi:RNA polymerase sigma-70 factor (ECF subfamily)